MFLITHWVLQLFIETHKHKEKEVERKTEEVIDGKSEEETVMMWCVQDEVNQEETKQKEVDGMKKEAGYREAHNQNVTSSNVTYSDRQEVVPWQLAASAAAAAAG